MTKTESLRAATKTIAIESCQEWLQCEMSEGVRAAIPNTNNLIMVGPQEWIAKNVPGVGVMVERASTLTDARIIELAESWAMTSYGYENDPRGHCIDFARAIEYAVVESLAATTQASTAQAERRGCASCEWEGETDRMCGGVGPLCPACGDTTEALSAKSSTDAQAAAEVRDTALVEAITECDLVLLGVDTPEESVGALNCRNAIRALRAGDTGEQADGGAA